MVEDYRVDEEVLKQMTTNICAVARQEMGSSASDIINFSMLPATSLIMDGEVDFTMKCLT
jgi:hypothetical protein